MALKRIHSFLVHPAKGTDEQPDIGGTAVSRAGQLGEMLNRVFDRAALECDIAIVFRPDENGRQENECRDDVVKYVRDATMANGRRLARRLQSVTTNRSGLGLLFLMTGVDGQRSKLVIFRFPADQGIIAEEDHERLSVEFLERIFMKSAKAYKSAMYASDSLDRGFWDGRAIDRQISGPKEVSDYWVQEFLMSDLRTTGPAGTKRLAVALRSAVQGADSLEVRQELIATAALLRGQDGRTVSARRLIEDLGLSRAASDELERRLPRAELMDETFRFDGEEFARHVLYRLIELDNGGVLLADDRSFSDVFEVSVLDPAEGLVRYSTEGHVVDERLKKSKG